MHELHISYISIVYNWKGKQRYIIFLSHINHIYSKIKMAKRGRAYIRKSQYNVYSYVDCLSLSKLDTIIEIQNAE